MELLPVKILYRPSHVQYPLVDNMRKWRLWESNGLDVELTLVESTRQAEEILEDGKADFIFGNHITPYYRRFVEGLPYVYLGQTVSHSQDILVAREAVADLRELEGKTIAREALESKDGNLISHPGLHVDLYLERAGVNTASLRQFIVQKSTAAKLEAVASGQADAAIVSKPAKYRAQKLGLAVTELEPLPMIQGITLTGLRPRVQERPELVKQVLLTLKQSIEHFLTHRDESIAVLQEVVAEKLGLSTREEVEDLYDQTARSLIPNLIPPPEAIINVFKEACIFRPVLKGRNPLEMWDLHYAQEISAS